MPSGARLAVTTHHGLRASVEVSVPTLLHGHNMYSSSVLETTDTIERLHREASQFVTWVEEPQGLSLSRVDVNAPIDGVDDLEHVLRALSHLRVPRTKPATLHCDPNLGGARTLVRGTKGWRAMLYDKPHQMRDLARRHGTDSAALLALAERHRGQVRFEAQVRRDGLRHWDLATVADLDEMRLRNMLDGYFARARFDQPIAGAGRLDQVLRDLHDRQDPDYKYVGQVVGLLMAERLNLRAPTTSPTSLAKYRDLARKWGISAGDFVSFVGPTVRLDLALGRLTEDAA